MTLARRLITAGSGGGIVLTPSASSLGQAGFWNEVAEPRSVTAGAKTFIGWATTAGAIQVGAFDHATRSMGSPFTLKSGLSPQDGYDHMSVSLCVRSSDQRVVAVYNAQGAQAFRRISTNPLDVSAWGAEAAILTSSALYTYGSLFEVTDGTLYYLTRRYVNPTFFTCYATSTDGGATWSAVTNIIQPVTTASTYWRAGVSGSKLHIFTTDTDRSDANQSSVYHLYLDGATLYKSDGTSIAGPYPVAANAGTLVQNTALGPARPEGWGFDGTTPAVLLFVYDSSNSRNLARVGRWNGSAWTVTAVADTVGVMGSNRYLSSGAMDKADPNRIFLPRKVGSYFELFEYLSTDDGATWTGTARTSESTSDNIRPDAPVGHSTAAHALWVKGTYTDGDTFDTTLHRYGV